MANWVLKFISGKYQGGEFPLEEGKEYHIGRSSESDMVLVEDMVSRNHAKIMVVEDIPKLYDLGSTNGSFVNGERVGDVDLHEGDRILFGTSIIKLIRTQVEDPKASSVLKADPDPAVTDAPRHTQAISRGSGVTMAGSMTGLLEEVSLPDLLQLFSTSRKSGVLRLIRGEEKAALYLRDGRCVYCEIEGLALPPDKAAFRAMTWETGMFVLEPPSDRSFDQEIEMSTEAMMMEAMRLMDEMANMGQKVPEPDDVIRIPKPLEPALSELSPDQLDVFQLAMNASTVADILSKALATDADTLAHIEFLAGNQYIELG